MKARLGKHCCRGKAISTADSECVFLALDMSQMKRMRRVILSSVSYLALPQFYTLSHERHNFGKQIL